MADLNCRPLRCQRSALTKTELIAHRELDAIASIGMGYIGKKNFWRKIKRPPLKGKKRRRIETIETDWKTYNSSSKILQKKIEKNPDNYEKWILILCESKQDMAIWETYYQIDMYLDDDWNKLYNQVINLRVRVR